MKCTTICMALLALCATLCNAQINELPTSVAKGRLNTTDGKKIEFTNLTTNPEQHTYVSAARTQTIPAADVLRIEQQTGTEAGKWALYLGAAGLIGSTLGVLSAKTDANNIGVETDNSKLVPIVLGLTVASALIGAAIGASKKKYKTVYDNPKYSSTSSLFAPVRIGIVAPGNRGIGIGLQYRLN